MTLSTASASKVAPAGTTSPPASPGSGDAVAPQHLGRKGNAAIRACAHDAVRRELERRPHEKSVADAFVDRRRRDRRNQSANDLRCRRRTPTLGVTQRRRRLFVAVDDGSVRPRMSAGVTVQVAVDALGTVTPNASFTTPGWNWVTWPRFGPTRSLCSSSGRLISRRGRHAVRLPRCCSRTRPWYQFRQVTTHDAVTVTLDDEPGFTRVERVAPNSRSGNVNADLS